MGLDSLEDIQKSIAREQASINNSISKEQKAIQKSIAKEVKISISKEISKEGRVRIPAKRRHEVENKYHNKCAKGHQNISGVKLQIHHINMKNNDNKLSNLELLCPNHHIQRHSKLFRKRYVKKGLLGTSVRTRLITKEKNKELNRKKAKQKRANTNLLGNPQFKMPKLLRGMFA